RKDAGPCAGPLQDVPPWREAGRQNRPVPDTACPAMLPGSVLCIRLLTDTLILFAYLKMSFLYSGGFRCYEYAGLDGTGRGMVRQQHLCGEGRKIEAHVYP